jgi:hypothetical protein
VRPVCRQFTAVADAIILTHRAMRFRRKIPVLVGLLVFVAAVTAVVELRKHAPPEPARLLPGAGAYVYMNFKWMRLADMAGKLPPVPHDPDYEHFIQQTGFQFERDLQQAAVAIHYASPATHGHTRYSEIFVAHFNGDKLRTYLRGLSSSVENYNQANIYNIPIEDRILRVAILGVDTVAASNYDDPVVIHGMVDRSHKLASPFGGPALLRRYYKEVPQLPLPSLAWAIFKADPSALAGPAVRAVEPVTVVASVQYLGAVHLRVEAFAKSEAAAQQLTSQADTFFKIFESAEVSVSGQAPDKDFQRAINSIKVAQNKSRVILTASLPSELVRKLVSSAPMAVTPGNGH